jgi:hypothetical protein
VYISTVKTINPASYYPVLQQLDSLWGLNFTNTFGPSNTACNCSSTCLWVKSYNGFACSGGLLSTISFNHPLTGILPSEIGLLTSVSSIILQNTNLSGIIPVEIGNLNLSHINLINNQFTGNLPLINSPIIYVGGNKLDGSISIPSNIVSLDISDNNFTGIFPDLNWSGLTYLNVSNNGFFGSIPNGLATSKFTNGSCILDDNYFNSCNISPTNINNNCTISCKASVCPGNNPSPGAICVNGQWQLVGNIMINNISVDSPILIVGNLTLENDSQLTVGNGIITVTGNVIIDGSLTIKTNNTQSKTVMYAGNISGTFNNINLNLDNCYSGQGVNDGTSFTVFIIDNCNKFNRRIIVAIVVSCFIFIALVIVVVIILTYRFCPNRMHIFDRNKEEMELPSWR